MKPLFLLLLLAVAAAAEPANFTHRITGLFAPDREADLRRVLEDELPEITLVSLDFEHAEGVFSYDPAAVFKDVKPENVAEKFNQKLGEASHHTFGIQPLCPTPRAQLTRVEIPVVGLDCRACCLATYEAIFKIDGVAQATASNKEGRVTALIDPARTDRAALEAALKKKNVTLRAP